MQKITPCLWFNRNVEEAVNFYVSVFKNSKIKSTVRYGEAGGDIRGRPPKGEVMTITFELEGQEFMALNGGPHFQFTPAISLMVNCKDQKELDAIWDKLSESGEVLECGWLTDKFGLSWQIVPTIVAELMQDKNSIKRDRVMRAILGMKKLDIATLRRAYAGDQS